MVNNLFEDYVFSITVVFRKSENFIIIFLSWILKNVCLVMMFNTKKESIKMFKKKVLNNE